jgi:antitoxin StbD
MHAKNYISATMLSKKTAATLDSLQNDETGKLIILKNNAPKAILLSVEAYEAMKEEMEDLRLATLAFARLKTFRLEKVASHEEMMKQFAQ